MNTLLAWENYFIKCLSVLFDPIAIMFVIVS